MNGGGEFLLNSKNFKFFFFFLDSEQLQGMFSDDSLQGNCGWRFDNKLLFKNLLFILFYNDEAIWVAVK